MNNITTPAGQGINQSMYKATYMCNNKKIKMDGWSYISRDKNNRKIMVTKTSIIFMNNSGEYWVLYDYGEDFTPDSHLIRYASGGKRTKTRKKRRYHPYK